MSFTWQPMNVDDFAAYQRGQGAKCVKAGGAYWRRVRPFFYRPLLLYQEVPPQSVKQPVDSLLGGCQFAIGSQDRANSLLKLRIFENTNSYTFDSLRDRKSEVRSALKRFRVAPVTDRERFKESGRRVYREFYDRTRYDFNPERQTPEGFARWTDLLFSFPGVLILGAYRDAELEGVTVTQLVDQTVLYSTAFASNDALRHNVSSLMLHTVRDACSRLPHVKQIFAGMYGFCGKRGVDGFYLLRGCSLVEKPAVLRANPIALAALRLLKPKELARLRGTLPDLVLDPPASAPPPPTPSTRIEETQNIAAGGS